MIGALWPFITILFLTSCGGPLAANGPELTLLTQSGAALTDVPAAVRLELRGLSDVSLSDIWLVRGDVSSVSSSSLRKGEIPQTIEKSRVPLAAWTDDDAIVLAPALLLESGETYSLVARGVGLLGEIVVSTEERPVLYRWGKRPLSEGSFAVYCAAIPPTWQGDSRQPSSDTGAWLETAGVLGVGGSSLAKDLCVQINVVDHGAGFFVPPSSLGQWLIDPQPIALIKVDGTDLPSETMSEKPCQGLQLSMACVSTSEASVEIELSAGTYAVEIVLLEEGGDSPNSPHYILSQSAEATSHVFGPTMPLGTYEVSVSCIEPCIDETEEAERVLLVAGPAAPRFVLNEVLADPLGAEPEAEWVEILNAGTKAGSLEFLEIWDSGGGSVLPDVVLEPGQYGLIVREDFSLGPDELPSAESKRVEVRSIGQNGLRNSGEVVSLRDTNGNILSSIVARSTAEGVSLSRRDPWASDDDSGFLKSAEPDSTPGAPNFPQGAPLMNRE